MQLLRPDNEEITQSHFDEICCWATPAFSKMSEEDISLLRDCCTQQFWSIVNMTPSPVLLLFFHVGTTADWKDGANDEYSKLSGVSFLQHIPFSR